MANKNLDQQKKNEKTNQISIYTKNCIVVMKLVLIVILILRVLILISIYSITHVPILSDFNFIIGSDEEGRVNGDRIIGRNGFLLRDMNKIQRLQLLNCLTCCVGKWTSVNTCNINKKIHNRLWPL